jgi:hypothetical protein
MVGNKTRRIEIIAVDKRIVFSGKINILLWSH